MPKNSAGQLFERAAFDEPVEQSDGQGGTINGWEEQFQCRGQFIFDRGNEAVEAARLTGRALYKIKIRNSSSAKLIDTDWRMRDARRGTEYQIREIDTITDRQWAYLRVESGVAG